MIAEIEKLGGKVGFDENSPAKPVIRVDLMNTKVTDAGLEHLIKGFSQLRRLDLHGTQVTDAGLEQVKGLSQLQELNLKGTQVTDLAWSISGGSCSYRGWMFLPK